MNPLAAHWAELDTGPRRRHVPLINDEYGRVCPVPAPCTQYPGSPVLHSAPDWDWDANEGGDYDDVWPLPPHYAFITSYEDKL